ncbi:MAG: Hsp20/alpha crystallin family protein [Lewinellaceae bacterium]|nr:Hsp20/alpha crystallin family protein [Phaeodactylibacter sp.]MCB9038978.1 Hsp20/alpha crystallin family protein [Lewinellaceae bacterium]
MCRGSHSWGRHHRRGHHHHHQGGRFGAAFAQFPVNVRELDDRYELDLFAPQLSREDFQLELVDRTLTISITASKEEEVELGQRIRQEYRPRGAERSFMLNEKIDLDNIKAAYAEGVLKVILPKLPGQVTQRRDVDVV